MASNSRVTGFPGSTELTTDTVENTVEETEDCREEAKRVRCSMPAASSPLSESCNYWSVSPKVEYVDDM